MRYPSLPLAFLPISFPIASTAILHLPDDITSLRSQLFFFVTVSRRPSDEVFLLGFFRLSLIRQRGREPGRRSNQLLIGLHFAPIKTFPRTTRPPSLSPSVRSPGHMRPRVLRGPRRPHVVDGGGGGLMEEVRSQLRKSRLDWEAGRYLLLLHQHTHCLLTSHTHTHANSHVPTHPHAHAHTHCIKQS